MGRHRACQLSEKHVQISDRIKLCLISNPSSLHESMRSAQARFRRFPENVASRLKARVDFLPQTKVEEEIAKFVAWYRGYYRV